MLGGGFLHFLYDSPTLLKLFFSRCDALLHSCHFGLQSCILLVGIVESRADFLKRNVGLGTFAHLLSNLIVLSLQLLTKIGNNTIALRNQFIL